MASYVIPEEIIPGQLFVPDAHDYFSIEANGMPNGDDCLVVHGDVSTNYKAFQPAQTVTPNLFKTVTQLMNFSISFWIKLGSVTFVSNPTFASTIFGLMSSLNASVTNHEASALGATGEGLWAFSAYSNTGIGFFECGYKPSGGTFNSRGAKRILTADEWTLVVLGHPGSGVGNPGIALNDEETYTGGWARSDTSAASWTLSPNLKFGIGAYSDMGSVNAREGEYRLGKLAFHDHTLNETERLFLYHAMVGDP